MKKILQNIIPHRFWPRPIEIPVIRLEGVIMAKRNNFNQNYLNLQNCAIALEQGFKMEKAPFIGLVINSPGGSATQSHLIYRYIRGLAARYKKKVIAFAEDVAASGGYMIACAADEIYSDPSSIIGSIGVVSGSFGFHEAIKKLGIERRIYKAGKNKVALDSFSPENPEDVKHLKRQLKEIHQFFINLVKESRCERLAKSNDLFTGMFWTGSQAKELGLIDGCHDLYSFVRQHYGENVKVKFIGNQRSLLAKIFASQGSFLDKNLDSFKSEYLWTRYGL